MEWNLGLNGHTILAIGQPSLDPPPPHHHLTHNIILSPKMMIVQGFKHPISYIGVCYANTPQNAGYVALTTTLDLTTLFEVLFLACVD